MDLEAPVQAGAPPATNFCAVEIAVNPRCGRFQPFY
jgi:hypothetical protein